jgi:signal transduction histidine kinase
METPAIPENENERLAALKEYDILDSMPERDFDDITRLASEICQTPISLITLVDAGRQWFKSHHGLDVPETKREHAFCAHAINDPEKILIVPDSRRDKRFMDNPLVTGDPHIVFYTGVPLLTPNGHALGTLCVIDHEPKKLNERQLDALTALANQVVRLIELRKANRKLEKLKADLEIRNKDLEQFAYVVSHDIKSPLSSIVLTAEMLRENLADSMAPDTDQLLKILNRSSYKIKNLVDGILTYYRGEQALYEQTESVMLPDFLQSIVEDLSMKQPVEINYPTEKQELFTNRTGLEQILVNLLQNSIKYNDKEKIVIDIGFWKDASVYHFSVTDNGKGMDEAGMSKIFDLFTTLGQRDRFGDLGSGIGLSTVKKLVERQGGTIHVRSSLQQGTTVEFSIPFHIS